MTLGDATGKLDDTFNKMFDDIAVTAHRHPELPPPPDIRR
jgi:hypothetical protein